MDNGNGRDRQRKSKKPETWTRDDILANGYWAPMPYAIMRTTKLSPNAKLLYAELLSWAWRNAGECRPPQRVLAWHLNVGVRQIQTLQTELEDVGAIVVIRRRSAKDANRPNKIRFAKTLKQLCPRERMINRRAIWEPAMEAEEAQKTGKRPPEVGIGG